MSDLHSIINPIIEAWAIDFEKKTRASSQVLPDGTGAGKSSINTKTRLATLNDIALITLEFQDHLRFFDLRKITHSKIPNIDEIKEFIKEKGLSKFQGKFVQKYQYLPPPTQLLNKIAWGIGFSMKARGTWKQKRKKWYSKGNEAAINRLYTMLLDGIAESKLQNLKNIT